MQEEERLMEELRSQVKRASELMIDIIEPDSGIVGPNLAEALAQSFNLAQKAFQITNT
jgi:hypothetical protein